MNYQRYKKIIGRIFTQKYYVRGVLLRKFLHFFSDRRFLEIKFYMRQGYKLNLNHPQTFNEKLQWLKLNDRKPEYTQMVDKFEVKKLVAEKIGEEHIIPTLAVYERAEDIDFDALPEQFVLKCTHNSGGLVICTDKNRLNRKAAIKKLSKALKRNYYSQNREWPYKNVQPRIIAEEYMTDGDNQLKDYKVFTFDGEPKIIEVDYNRFTGHLRNLYDTDWKKIDAVIEYPSDPNVKIDKPKVLDELLELSKSLSMGIPHVRTDFYIVDNQVFFGELTFFHGSGMEKIVPDELNRKMGDWILLPINMGGAILYKDGIYLYLSFQRQEVEQLKDYKIFCFNGEPKFIEVDYDRYVGHKLNVYDLEWNFIDFYMTSPNNRNIKIKRPEMLDLMLDYARTLSEGITFLRVDLYSIGKKIYFGELTFHPGSGMIDFHPKEYDSKLGKMLKLPIDNI